MTRGDGKRELRRTYAWGAEPKHRDKTGVPSDHFSEAPLRPSRRKLLRALARVRHERERRAT